MNKRNLRVNWLLASLLIGSAGSSAQSELPALKPQVRFIPAPLAPSATPPEGPSVLVGFSPFYVSQGGLQDATAIYEPVREGGFRICGSTRRLNRPIIHGQNRVWTGDVPVFRMDTYRDSIPLWVSQETVKPLAVKTHSFGTLRLGVATGDGKTTWLDTLPGTTTATFLPGYTDYQVAAAKGEWKATIRVAVASGMHGLICRVEFDRPMPLVWQYGDVFLTEAKPPSTEVTVAGTEARFVTPDLPNGLVLAGWDGEGTGQKTQEGRFAQFASGKPRRIYHVVAAWGVNRFDAAVAERAHKNLLSTPAAKAWPEEAERLWQAWLDCFVTPALKPEEHFRSLLAAPAEALDRSVSVWTARREEFQIRTPDEHLDALMNWSRAVSEYHRQGPGLFLGTHAYCLYGHISVGWYGKQWAGDHATVEQVLRLYAAGQGEDGKPRDNFFFGNQIRSGDGGWISWVGWNLGHWLSEDNTPHWVNQVWQHYRWTGDRVFVRDLWPVIEKAVAWECQQHDADGDGLFISYYPYWNCDSWACLAKSACATTVGWAMLDAAAHLAEVASQPQAAAKYRALADKTRTAANRELWNEQAGLLTSVGSDGLRYSHPYSWEVALAVNLGLVEWQRGRRAMRWVESHYGFEGTRPDVRLLMTSDLWPLRWSNHWVSNGDTLLCALAAMKCGEVDLWWPYLKTCVHSAFRSEYPGINFAINNTGLGSGDREDVDSDDPHTHMTVRGLFGIEPALDEGQIFICPAFPTGWTEASIKTPDVSYDYRREGDRVTFRIRTPRPLVKHVRANLTGREVVTPAETESVVTVTVGPALPELPKASHPPAVLVNRQPAPKPVPLSPAQRERLVLVDLAAAYNITAEQLMTTPMLFDNRQSLMHVKDWWVNPSLTMPPTPGVIETEHGVRFLTAGRAEGADAASAPKSLVALSSWRPYPWPAGVTVPIGRKCERVWLLLQNYVHPSKCYVPNGEVVLRYAGGKQDTTSLVPPYNLDCFYQHFSREGVAVPFGKFDNWPPKTFSPANPHSTKSFMENTCHADALEIAADPDRTLEAVELRATCSEGMLGLAGLTLLTKGD